jgi:hypothetical protein
VKAFELLTTINMKTKQFVPCAQYMLFPFDTVNYNFFNLKPKTTTDKGIPETIATLKLSKKHLETQEVKDRIIKETLDALTHYYAANAANMSFPELIT